ncbi:S8 family serine peptidase [Gramella sp. AN32]|uniref:S8 family serine peptidase n=1 Tax=Christiangramia antarctica TaxID=2058158 RepID=A0ABW5X9S8_9FLAO|nr:S8 family serine peptidase [Gramella sp. AN32]MCM4154505.1 serine protease [Gramella sp. AN32]
MQKFLLLFIFISFTTFGQEEHAWVYFKDKPNVEASISNPLSILSARAVQRKSRHSIAIDFRDVPVNESYLAEIKSFQDIAVKSKSKWLNCVHVIGELGEIEKLKELEFVSSIEYADDNLNTRSQLTNNYGKVKLETSISYDYGFAENQVNMLGTDFLHQNDLTGEGMIIAVLDAGFPNVNTLSGFEKIRNEGKLLGGFDFPGRSNDFNNPELNNHGTLVLSNMAGFIEEFIVGTAPDAAYYLFRTEIAATETPVEESYWVEAAERADSLGVDVINSSLSYALFDNPAYNYTAQDMDGQTAFSSRGASIASEKGILVVVSGGNSGESDVFPGIGAPADADVLTVGAVDPDRNRLAFSSVGPTADGRIKPDVMAQGSEVVVLTPDNRLVAVSGTSFSSPLMAGSAASFWQANPELSNYKIMDLIRESSSNAANPNNLIGYGIPNFALAYENLQNEVFTSEELVIFPNPVENFLNFRAPETGGYHLTIFDIIGRKILERDQVEEQIDLSGFSRGIYIAMFEKDNFNESRIIIKK